METMGALRGHGAHAFMSFDPLLGFKLLYTTAVAVRTSKAVLVFPDQLSPFAQGWKRGGGDRESENTIK